MSIPHNIEHLQAELSARVMKLRRRIRLSLYILFICNGMAVLPVFIGVMLFPRHWFLTFVGLVLFLAGQLYLRQLLRILVSTYEQNWEIDKDSEAKDQPHD